MLTKIKNFVKKVTVLEWAVLGIALVALFIALAPKPAPANKSRHKADKQAETASVEVPAAK